MEITLFDRFDTKIGFEDLEVIYVWSLEMN